MRYEERFERIKDLPPYDIGIKLGLNTDNSIMLQEIMEYKLEEIVNSALEFSRN